jgi:hypothetical protein
MISLFYFMMESFTLNNIFVEIIDKSGEVQERPPRPSVVKTDPVAPSDEGME